MTVGRDLPCLTSIWRPTWHTRVRAWHKYCGQNLEIFDHGSPGASTTDSGVLPLSVQVWVQGSGDSGPQMHFYLFGKWTFPFSMMPSQATMRFLLAFRIKAFIKIFKSLASIVVPKPTIHRATISINCSRQQSALSGPAVTCHSAFPSQPISHLLKCLWEAWGNQPYGNVTDFIQSYEVTSQNLFPPAALSLASSHLGSSLSMSPHSPTHVPAVALARLSWQDGIISLIAISTKWWIWKGQVW